jgi:hypothetical protein
MSLQKEFAAARSAWQPLTLYQKFEHLCILILIALIAIVIVFAIWNLALKILISVFTTGFDPTDYAVFQAVFGMMFTVIIALERRGADRPARDRAQDDHPRPEGDRGDATVRAERGDPRARRRVLAGARAGSAPQHGGRADPR